MNLWTWLFNAGVREPGGTPADHKAPHDARDDETVDASTGIGMEDGQEIDDTEIDQEIQDKEKGFDVKDPENP